MHPGALLLAYASLFVYGLVDNARGPVFPEVLQGLGLSDTAGAVMFAATSAGALLGSLAARRVPRGSTLALLRGALVLSSGGVALCALAPSLPWLAAGSLGFGLGAGALSVAQNLLVSLATPPGLRRQALAGLHAMYGMASLLAPLVVAGLTTRGADWRGCLLALAGAPLLLLLPSWAVRAPAAPPAAAAAGALRWPHLRLALAGGLGVVAELAVSTRLVLLLRRDGLAPELAALALSGFFAGLLGGRLLFTLLPLPLGSRRLLQLSALSTLVVGAAGLLLEPLLLAGVGLCLAPFFPAAVDLLAEEHPGEFDQALAVLVAACGLLVMAAHGLIGWASDLASVRAALWISPLACLLALGLLRAPRPRPVGAG